MRSSEIQSDEMACGKNAVIYNQSKFITSQKNCEDDTASETWVSEYKLDLEVVLGVCSVHPVRKNGPIKKKLYWNIIGTTEIVGKKKFKIWCHMLGYNDSSG